jgi:hypothetical protein
MSELRPYPHTQFTQVLTRPSTKYIVFSSPYAFLGVDNKEECHLLSYEDVKGFLELGDPYIALGKQWMFLGW